ncbi:MAG: hypothetical protein ACI4BD_06960 [Paludibacteraceae bacterium]
MSVVLFILCITAMYAGMLYTYVRHSFKTEMVYEDRPWEQVVSPGGIVVPSSVARGEAQTPSVSSPRYSFRSTGGMSMSSGSGTYSIRIPSGGSGSGTGLGKAAGGSSFSIGSTAGSGYAPVPGSGYAQPAGGAFLTSGAVTHSYGGGTFGATAGSGTQQNAAARNAAGQSAVPTGTLSTTLSLPTYTLAYTPAASLTADQDQQAAVYAAVASAQWQQYGNRFGTGFTSGISSSYNSADIASYLSADDYLAYGQTSIPPKRNAAPSIGGGATAAWLNWLLQQWADGKTDITLAELRALYDQMRAEDGDFANTYTWEDFYNWFLSQQGSDDFKWALPVGDGTWVMLTLIALYLLYKTLVNTLTN